MRENFLAFVVRPAGDTWEALLLSTACGAAADQFDLPRARVPHNRDPDAVIRQYLAQYGIAPVERLATLGDEPLLESRRRTVYLYRGPASLPDSWSMPIPPPRKLKVPMPPIVAHFRFVDLRQPLRVQQDEAGWADEARRAVGLPALEPITMVVFSPASRSDASTAPAVVDALAANRSHRGAAPADFAGLAQRIRAHSGWTHDPRRLQITPISVDGRDVGLLARLKRDGRTVAEARATVIALAGWEGMWTCDLSARRLFRQEEQPAPHARPSTGRELREVPFSRELVQELARLGAPLMMFPLSPPVDEYGHREDYRDESLPYSLWKLPANQRLILDGSFFGYFFCNDGLICPVVTDVEPLRAHNQRRTILHPGGATTTYAYEQTAGWDEVVEHLGWAYLPNGPDTLWGDLYVSQRHLPLLEGIRDWCLHTGKSWVRYEQRGDEVVQVREGVVPRRST